MNQFGWATPTAFFDVTCSASLTLVPLSSLETASKLNGGNMATSPQRNEELVQVFDTEQESEALVVRGLLESAGIDAIVTGLDAPQDVLPGVGGVVIRVPADQADEARNLIEDYRSHGDAEDGELNSEVPELDQ
jgi:hypothetical protein